MNLILLHSAELDQSGQTRLADARAAHLVTVLRVTPGQTVRVGLLEGPFGIGTVTAAYGEAARLGLVIL